jgi:hypothetical protein
METKIGTMVRQSKNEGGDAHYKATADSARDTEKPPYKLTATEKEALAKFEAASETRRGLEADSHRRATMPRGRRNSSRQPRYSRLANIEATRQVGLAGATVSERIQRLALLMSGKLWRSTHMNPTRLGASSTFPGSSTYQTTFKLGEAAKTREHQSAMRRGRVSPNVGQ